MVALVAGVRPAGVRAQTPQAPRRVSFADVATTVAQRNLQVRAASFDVAVAQAQLAQARGARQPSVTVSGSYTQMQSIPGQTVTIPNPFGPAPPTITFAFPASDTNQVAVRVGLQFPLYTGGRIESQIALAEANLRGAQAVFARTIQQVVFQAQQAYLGALLARENLAAAQRTLDQANESLQVARARVAAGVAAEFDALQADVSVAGAQQGLVRAQVGVRNSDASLNALLNQPLGTPLAFSDTLEPRAVAGTMEASIEQALRTRPELVEVRARAEAARASIELAASGRPNLSLSSGYEFSGPTGIVGGWSATLAVTLSLYDGGITRAHPRGRSLEGAVEGREAHMRQRIELEVRQAWLALEQANGELAAAGKGVDQAREATRIAGVRYQAGVGTLLEVTSAQASLAQAEFSLALARFNHHLARSSHPRRQAPGRRSQYPLILRS
jgi:outer membrane protein TolC